MDQTTQADAPAGDTGYAPARWAFDDEVTRVFEDMLRRSIPQYDAMRSAVFDLACAYAKDKTDLVDLGCSRGDGLAPLIDRFGAYNRYVGVDVSEPMLAACRERFASWIKNGLVTVKNMDLRRDYPAVQSSVTLAVLTVQFTPIEHRQRILANVYKHLLAGGAFVMVEKVLGADDSIDAALVARHHALKLANGYTPDDIERKRLALEGVLVPVTSRWNEDMLRSAGFRHVDCFWRWMNFAAWVAVK